MHGMYGMYGMLKVTGKWTERHIGYTHDTYMQAYIHAGIHTCMHTYIIIKAKNNKRTITFLTAPMSGRHNQGESIFNS